VFLGIMLSNHFWLLTETKAPSISSQMSQLRNFYSNKWPGKKSNVTKLSVINQNEQKFL